MALTHCVQCGHLVSDKAERCPQCKTTEYLSSAVNSGAMGPMIGEVSTHLVGLGYRVEQNDELRLANHDTMANFSFRELFGGVLLVAIISGREDTKRDKLGFLSYINSINENVRNVILIRCSGDRDGNLIVSAWYPHRYERDSFGLFMERWNADITVLVSDQNEASKYLV
jgi:hypothetical protein